MPVTPTYPGVYIEEIPSGVRTIVGVATSITAFIGRARRGPVNKSVTINSFSDFERIFGGLWLDSSLGFAVQDFYMNGGSQAIIVRLFHPAFADETERAKAEAAAQDVADAATGAAGGGAASKTAANAKRDAIVGDGSKSAAEKSAAVTAAAEIGKLKDDADAATITAAAKGAVVIASGTRAEVGAGNFKLAAADEGSWGANLRLSVDMDNITDPNLFNLTVQEAAPGGISERFTNLSLNNNAARRVDRVLWASSSLARWDGSWPPSSLPDLAAIRTAAGELATELAKPAPDPATVASKQDALWALTRDPVTIAEAKYSRAVKTLQDKQNADPTADVTAEKDAVTAARTAMDEARKATAAAVSDGSVLGILDFLPANGETNKQGLYALEQADLFNLLAIPPYKAADSALDVDVNLISAAAAYCEKRRAMLLVDAPKDWTSKSKAREKFTDPTTDFVGTRSRNAALFFPRLRRGNLLREDQVEDFSPLGAVAGVFARTDVERGVWKAPAGLDAGLRNAPQLTLNLTDPENGELNPLGINSLRSMPGVGRVVWGSRTLRGSDQLADEYKYIPVRRTALFIEESLFRGLQWVVFEPNDEPLWSQIRLNVGAFMHNLFRKGAFQGRTPREAYLVKCDRETTTQNDINLGIVNIIVGFAPLKPAEFVILKLQQLAGQVEA